MRGSLWGCGGMGSDLCGEASARGVGDWGTHVSPLVSSGGMRVGKVYKSQCVPGFASSYEAIYEYTTSYMWFTILLASH